MNDEQQIRQLVDVWMTASKRGDIHTVLSLMTDDALFMMAGQPVMNKQQFAAAMQAQSGHAAPSVDGESNILEIQVTGEWAYMRSSLRVIITMPDGHTITRAGHTLSILRKQDGRWLLARDANMLTTI
ncbi:MAG: SgcJ/EcaC family oxidoreductase [Steroidobacter sp.]|jgi:uncharacterized protein (TIGR02246 family)